MTPEEVYQRMTAALGTFKNVRVEKDTESRIHDAIRDILVEAFPQDDDISRWIKVKPVLEFGSNVIGVLFYNHPDPPKSVAEFIKSLRDHGFQITPDLGRFDDTN